MLDLFSFSSTNLCRWDLACNSSRRIKKSFKVDYEYLGADDVDAEIEDLVIQVGYSILVYRADGYRARYRHHQGVGLQRF